MADMTDEMFHHFTANVSIKRKNIMLNNFLGGLAWGFGTVVGATVVVAMLIGLLKTVNFVPIVGGFVTGVLDQVQQNQASSLFKK